MVRIGPIPLLLLLACSPAGGGDGPAGYQGYDDDDAASDDDDAGDDDAADDDDFTPGATELDPCETWQLLEDDASCAEVPVEPIRVDGARCPPGERTVRNRAAWDHYLRTDCSWGGEDPLAGHDWDAQAVLASAFTGAACSISQKTLWVRACADGTRLAHFSFACGICEEELSALTLTPVAHELLPVTLEACIPYNELCEV